MGRAGTGGPLIALAWDNAAPLWPGVVTQVWSSTNLINWVWRTNVVGMPGTNNPANRATFPRDQPGEFFKIRNCDTNTGLCSDWCRK